MILEDWLPEAESVITRCARDLADLLTARPMVLDNSEITQLFNDLIYIRDDLELAERFVFELIEGNVRW